MNISQQKCFLLIGLFFSNIPNILHGMEKHPALFRWADDLPALIPFGTVARKQANDSLEVWDFVDDKPVATSNRFESAKRDLIALNPRLEVIASMNDSWITYQQCQPLGCLEFNAPKKQTENTPMDTVEQCTAIEEEAFQRLEYIWYQSQSIFKTNKINPASFFKKALLNGYSPDFTFLQTVLAPVIQNPICLRVFAEKCRQEVEREKLIQLAQFKPDNNLNANHLGYLLMLQTIARSAVTEVPQIPNIIVTPAAPQQSLSRKRKGYCGMDIDEETDHKSLKLAEYNRNNN